MLCVPRTNRVTVTTHFLGVFSLHEATSYKYPKHQDFAVWHRLYIRLTGKRLYPPFTVELFTVTHFLVIAERCHPPDSTKFPSPKLPAPAHVERPKQLPCFGLATVGPTPWEDLMTLRHRTYFFRHGLHRSTIEV